MITATLFSLIVFNVTRARYQRTVSQRRFASASASGGRAETRREKENASNAFTRRSSRLRFFQVVLLSLNGCIFFDQPFNWSYAATFSVKRVFRVHAGARTSPFVSPADCIIRYSTIQHNCDTRPRRSSFLRPVTSRQSAM